MKEFFLWIFSLVGGLMGFLLQGELRALFAYLSEGLVKRAARKIPEEARQPLLDQWLADLDILGQQGRYLSQLGHGFQFYRNAWSIAWAATFELPKIQQVLLAGEYMRWCERWGFRLSLITLPVGVACMFETFRFDIPGLTLTVVLIGLVVSVKSFLFLLESLRVRREVRFAIKEIRAFEKEVEELEALIEARASVHSQARAASV